MIVWPVTQNRPISGFSRRHTGIRLVTRFAPESSHVTRSTKYMYFVSLPFGHLWSGGQRGGNRGGRIGDCRGHHWSRLFPLALAVLGDHHFVVTNSVCVRCRGQPIPLYAGAFRVNAAPFANSSSASSRCLIQPTEGHTYISRTGCESHNSNPQIKSEKLGPRQRRTQVTLKKSNTSTTQKPSSCHFIWVVFIHTHTQTHSKFSHHTSSFPPPSRQPNNVRSKMSRSRQNPTNRRTLYEAHLLGEGVQECFGIAGTALRKR